MLQGRPFLNRFGMSEAGSGLKITREGLPKEKSLYGRLTLSPDIFS